MKKNKKPKPSPLSEKRMRETAKRAAASLKRLAKK